MPARGRRQRLAHGVAVLERKSATVNAAVLLAELRLPAAPADLDALAGRGTGLVWWHLARSALPMGELAGVLRAAPGCPPRTGHLADWRDIWAGRSRVLDYNAVICRLLETGYPLLYDFTQTETSALDRGDTLYLPGSVLPGGIRQELELQRWQDGRFVRHDRSQPLFLPYVQARMDGGALPLPALHRRLAAELPPPWAVEYHSALWARHRGRIRQILVTLAEQAPGDRQLGQVFDRVVHRDGRVQRVPAARDGTGFRAGTARYPSADALVTASLLPLDVALCEDGLHQVMAELPPSVPLASVDVMALSYALLGAHRAGRAPAGDGEPDVHVQWGALAMAGCPPGSHGYFARRVNKVRWMYDAVVRHLPWACPVAFVMAPVAPYFLWLPATDEQDLAALELLLRRVRAAIGGAGGLLSAATPRAGRVTGEWLAEGRLSASLRRRLEWRDRVADGPRPVDAAPAVLRPPAGFGELTVAQACLVVSSLIAAARAAPGGDRA
jgi:uncharacterized protein DUF6025